MKRATLVTSTVATVLAVPYVGRSQSPTTIQIAGPLTIDLAPVVYAVRSGMYRQEGLDVELVPTSSGAAATTAVVAGTYQMSKGSCIASIIAHLRGLPLTVVANEGVWTPKTPFAQAVVTADSTIKSGTDLNGKIAGSPALNDINQLLDLRLDRQDRRRLRASVKWVEIPNSAAADGPAPVADRCAASRTIRQLSAALERGKVRALTPAYSAIAEFFVWGTCTPPTHPGPRAIGMPFAAGSARRTRPRHSRTFIAPKSRYGIRLHQILARNRSQDLAAAGGHDVESGIGTAGDRRGGKSTRRRSREPSTARDLYFYALTASSAARADGRTP